MGWYGLAYEQYGSLKKTGTDIDNNSSNMVKNIYDMAGNAYEWTMEAYSDGNVQDRILRAGEFYSDGYASPASVRVSSGRGTIDTKYYVGFRVALYIK